jgi:hypothetical protein
MSSKSKKKPLVRRVTVYTDDAPLLALGDARDELETAEIDAKARYEQRISLVRAVNPSAVELLTTETSLHTEQQAYLQPYRDALTAAEDAVRAASEQYVFKSPGHRAYQDLLAEHPPTEDDHDRARKVTGRAETLALWHDETFEPALISMCCIGAGLTVEEADKLVANLPPRNTERALSIDEASELRDEWTDAEWDQLWDAAILVSRGVRQVDLGKSSRPVSQRD